MGTIRGVIFDMEGLMFDIWPLWADAWEHVVPQAGYALPEGMVDAVRGRAGAPLMEALRHYLGEDVPVEAIWEEERRVVYERIAEEGIPTKPGLGELLEYLHDCQIPMAVVSSTPKYLIEANLWRARIAPFFDVVVSGDSIGRGMPDPSVFIEAATLLGTDPRRTIVLEDSPDGVEAGFRGGFITVMVSDLDLPTKQTQAMAAAIVRRLDDVIDLIEEGGL